VAVKEAGRGLRVNYLIIFLSGLVLLITAILVFMLIVKNIYGNYEVTEILPTKKNLRFFDEERKYKAAILYSQYTENMLNTGSTWLKDNVDTWKRFVGNSKIKYDVISDQTIELGEHFNYKLMYFPDLNLYPINKLYSLKNM